MQADVDQYLEGFQEFTDHDKRKFEEDMKSFHEDLFKFLETSIIDGVQDEVVDGDYGISCFWKGVNESLN